MSEKTNRIWIELDKAENKEHGELQCKLANALLTKLYDFKYDGEMNGFFYMPEGKNKNMYCFASGGTYRTLGDRGEWFNLDNIK